MSTPPDKDLNPYAPPVSEARIQAVDQEVPMKRPKSTKWAIVVFTWLFIVNLLAHGRFVLEQGWRHLITGYLEHTVGLMESMLFTVCFVALTAGGRRPWIYWTTTFALGLVCYNCAMHWRQVLSQFPHSERHVTLAFYLPFCLLLLLLFYRFAFGLPNRIYYRLARVSQDGNKVGEEKVGRPS